MKEVYEQIIKNLTKTLDNFVGQCLNEDGTIKAPTKQNIYYVRGCLPIWCKNTLVKKKQ